MRKITYELIKKTVRREESNDSKYSGVCEIFNVLSKRLWLMKERLMRNIRHKLEKGNMKELARVVIRTLRRRAAKEAFSRWRLNNKMDKLRFSALVVG